MPLVTNAHAPHQFTAETPTSANFNDTGKGIIGYALTTVPTGPSGANIDIAGLSVDVTNVAGRRVRIDVNVDILNTVANDHFQVVIYQAGVIVGAIKTGGIAYAAATVTASGFTLVDSIAGVSTYKASAQRLVGSTGNWTAAAGALLIVTDEGVAF